MFALWISNHIRMNIRLFVATFSGQSLLLKKQLVILNRRLRLIGLKLIIVSQGIIWGVILLMALK